MYKDTKMKKTKKSLYYSSPKTDNEEDYVVPIVVKNKDYLVAYIYGMNIVQDIILDGLKNAGVVIGPLNIEPCLDSSRFNDILENGKHERDLNKEELKEYYDKLIKQKIELSQESHPDNDPEIFNKIFLKVDCSCGLGIYSFKTPKEVPEKNLICDICGRTIIDYTGHDDHEYEFDGKRD